MKECIITEEFNCPFAIISMSTTCFNCPIPEEKMKLHREDTSSTIR